MASDTSAFEQRSAGKVVALGIVTFGLYALYWIHQVHKQFAAAKGDEFDPTMRTVGLLVPFYGFLVMWKTSNDAEDLLPDASAAVVFVTWLVLFPVMMYIVQSGINEAA